MMIDLTDKVAVVTGGASGIGRGICKALAGQGADIVVADMNAQGAKSTADEIAATGRKASVVDVDVTDRDSAANLVAVALRLFGKIDILVNDAGVAGAAEWWKRPTPSDDDWDLVLAVNLRGVVNVSEAAAPHMIERRYGKIINIASIAARQGGADIPHYNASKAAVVSWTQSHALQMAPYDINVNAICPGLLWTPMFEGLVERSLSFGSALGSNPELRDLSGRDYFEKLVESVIPMRKEQTPEDIGKLAAFLASDDAHNITGQAINVDGGRRMN
ncbi:MAG: SDR family oxidoreductase [Chloroflexi bacterium]|nr:SDR family oxidoreductase [Chloroflexota bacterium]